MVARSFAGRRTLRQFTVEAYARAKTRRVSAQLAMGQSELAEISRRDHEEPLAARKFASDVPLHAALEEWAKAFQIVEWQLIAAAEAWAARQGTKIEAITIADGTVFFVRQGGALRTGSHLQIDVRKSPNTELS